MQKVHNIIKDFWGKLSYLSLNSIKDLKLKSTGGTINLYHLQHGPYASHTDHIIPNDNNAYYMFCVTNYDPIIDILEKINVTTNITASIIYYKMENFNWSYILTSDI
jgi:hypothetical protein